MVSSRTNARRDLVRLHCQGRYGGRWHRPEELAATLRQTGRKLVRRAGSWGPRPPNGKARVAMAKAECIDCTVNFAGHLGNGIFGALFVHSSLILGRTPTARTPALSLLLWPGSLRSFFATAHGARTRFHCKVQRHGKSEACAASARPATYAFVGVVRPLLRPYRERPWRRRAAEQRDELAPSRCARNPSAPSRDSRALAPRAARQPRRPPSSVIRLFRNAGLVQKKLSQYQRPS